MDSRIRLGLVRAKIEGAMKRLCCFVTMAIGFVAFEFCGYSQTPSPERPRILGIDHVSFYTTAPDGVKTLDGGTLGLASASPVEPGGLLRYLVGKQWVGYSQAPDPDAIDRMDHVAFATTNIVALRQYLVAKGVTVPAIENRADIVYASPWPIRKAIALSSSSAAKSKCPHRLIPRFPAT
jgi:hypothetical protein